ncbi:MAG: serine/threonine protein kinase [Deltaproteobacteria bacterium]|nr:serine/threonine protein kinase [Deltaproteobacteria bacterium]
MPRPQRGSANKQPEAQESHSRAENQAAPGGDRYEAGQVIADKYALVRKLGEGGMGTVWVAHNEALDVHVAVKLIRADRSTPEMEQRLSQEARATAHIDHPAIVRVYDLGKTRAGDPFIVMELLDGENLGELLEREGRMSAVSAVKAVLPVAHALAEAHGKGIVHRDVKPENIFLARATDGRIQPKLLDFGIAKFERKEGGRLTQMGAAMGSPLYMAPEQACGEEADERTDIWAFCVVIYETVTGTCPFGGANYRAQLFSILEGTPPPITSQAAGDAALQAIIERGLQKRPEARWQSMRDLGEALARWLIGLGEAEDLTGTSLRACWLQRGGDGARTGGFLPDSPAVGSDLKPTRVPGPLGDSVTNPGVAPGASTQASGSTPTIDIIKWGSGSGDILGAQDVLPPGAASHGKTGWRKARFALVSVAVAILIAAAALLSQRSRTASLANGGQRNVSSGDVLSQGGGIVQSSLAGSATLAPASGSNSVSEVSASMPAVSVPPTRESGATDPRHGARPPIGIQPKQPRDSTVRGDKTSEPTSPPAPPARTTKLKSAYE